MIDLSQCYIAVLPMIVAFVAGIIRQDKLPPLINDAITLVTVLILATIQALLGGKLVGGSPLADFVLVASYATALARTPLLASLQQYMQSHVLSLGKPAIPTTAPTAAPTGAVQPIIHIDVPSLAQQLLGQLNLQQLAVLLRDELIKASQPVSQQPTSPMPTAQPVRANTPPVQTWQGQPPRAG